MDDIIIDEYTNSDKAACIDLLKRSFGDSSHEGTFKWRFESHSRPKPLVLRAKHKDKVVAFLSWIPWEFVFKEKKFWGYQAGELATDIHYRGQGLATKLLNYGNEIAAENEVSFFFSFPIYSSPSAKAHYKAGYLPIGNYYTRIRFIKPYCRNTIKEEKSPIDLFEDVLIENCKITPLFNRNYYNWRYANNTKSYEIVKYNEHNNKSVFILRKRELRGSKLKYLMLLDCQFTTLNNRFIEKFVSLSG